MKILLTGANGQVGRCFSDRVSKTDIKLIPVNKTQLNITDELATKKLVRDRKPDVIVNAAAYTMVDKAEDNIAQAYAVNEMGSKYLAESANELDIPIIHISTDYVFDGASTLPYKTDVATNPKSVYGESKLAGELAVLKASNKATIIRTAWVYSQYGNNFVKTMLRLGRSNKSLNIVGDQIGNPTNAVDIADVIYQLSQMKGFLNDGGKIHHFSGNTTMSWYDFAKCIFSLASSYDSVFNSLIINKISSNEFQQKALRPQNSSLENTLIHYGDDLLSLNNTIATLLSKES